MMSMVDPMAIDMEKLRIGHLCSLEIEFIELMYESLNGIKLFNGAVEYVILRSMKPMAYYGSKIVLWLWLMNF